MAAMSTTHPVAGRTADLARTDLFARAWPLLQRISASWPWLAAAVAALPIFWPFYREGLPRSFDGGLHLLRLGVLDRALRDGILLPRWSAEQLLGFGYPVFGYYAPAAYYLAELLHLAGLSFYAAFVAAFVLLMLAAATGMACLAWETFGRRPWPTVVAALAYLYAPYLVTNTYIRGALAEVAAMALLPWILWSARRLVLSSQPGRGILPLAFTLATLALTHNITLLFVPPLLLAYLALLWFSTGRRRVIGRAALALALAAALSAFFWLPLLLERSYISGAGFEIARTVWLPASAWTWSNFLDRGWHYTHTFARPIRLGIVQIGLAAAGALAWAGVAGLRREGFFWIGVALITGLLMTTWALPLWLASDLLVLAQFTWRLLSVHSLALALLSGGMAAAARPTWLTPLLGLAAVAATVGSGQPRLGWIDVFAPESVDVGPAVLAQTEVEKGVLGGGEGNSSVQEFRPRWAPATLAAADGATPASLPEIMLHHAGPTGLAATVHSDQAIALRVATFYFPGWVARLDDAQALSPYPSTTLGLLTVDLPAGDHRLLLRWRGTPLQQTAGFASLAALLVALGVAWRSRQPAWGAFAAGCLFLGALAAALRPPLPAVQSPAQPVAVPGLSLVAYRTEQPSPERLLVFPHWLVTAGRPPAQALDWRLVDAAGTVVAATRSTPYFNALPADIWPVGALADDAYELPLPAGLPAGDYHLQLRAAADPAVPAQEISVVTLAAVPPAALAPDVPFAVRFGPDAQLAGYMLEVERRVSPAPDLPVVRPGDYLRYRLFWRAEAPLAANLHGFVHLVDVAGRPLVQEDQLPGPFFQPPRLWTQARLRPDTYLLRIPGTATSGVYYPWVGLYDFVTLERLPVASADGAAPADAYRLPPVKVLAPAPAGPAHPLDYRLGDLVTLAGYDLTPDNRTLSTGRTLTVTLHFEVRGSTDQDLVRFVQLYSPERGVVSQQDAPPVNGANPTWSWQPGEHLLDPVRLDLPAGIPPGHYRLYAGLYTPGDGVRLPVVDAHGAPVPESWAYLADLEITAPKP
jgi:hypothetical protein